MIRDQEEKHDIEWRNCGGLTRTGGSALARSGTLPISPHLYNSQPARQKLLTVITHYVCGLFRSPAISFNPDPQDLKKFVPT
jgi:hypothetical protein